MQCTQDMRSIVHNKLKHVCMCGMASCACRNETIVLTTSYYATSIVVAYILCHSRSA